MSGNNKKLVQKNSFSSSLSESESEISSDSNDYSNKNNHIEQSRMLEPDSNSDFLKFKNHSTSISLGSISGKDIKKFKCEVEISDIKILSPIPDKKDDESLEDEFIEDLAGNIQKNDTILNLKDEEKEESLKMLGKKRKISHNSEFDSDPDDL